MEIITFVTQVKSRVVLNLWLKYLFPERKMYKSLVREEETYFPKTEQKTFGKFPEFRKIWKLYLKA